MATCKDLRRRLAQALKAERQAHDATRAANAAVRKAVDQLPPYYVTTAAAAREREAARPLIAQAQKASDRWGVTLSDLVNLRAAVADRCKQKE